MVSHRFAWSLALAFAAPATGQTAPAEIVEIADISGLSASPDGRWIAYRLERPSIARNVITTRWYVVPADGSDRPRDVGSGGLAMWNGVGVVQPGTAHWAADSRTFYARALIDDAVGVWAFTIDGQAPQSVVVGDANVSRFTTIGNGEIVYETGPSRDAVARAEAAERDHGVLVDERVDLAQGAYRGAVINGRAASERWSGRWFEREALLASEARTVRVHNLPSGRERAASPGERSRLDAPSSALPEDIGALLPHSARDLSIVSHVALSSERWAITLQDKAIRQQIWIADPEHGGATILQESEGLLNGGRAEKSPCAHAAEALVCVEASPNVPPRLVRVALAGGPIQVLHAPNADHPGRALDAEFLTWNAGGEDASGWLIRPEGPGPHPLFITYYRCSGYLRGGLGDEWPLFALASSGIAALCMNAVSMTEDRPEARYVRGLAAVRSAIEKLAGEGTIDPDRVGMGGLSFGSEVAMWVASHSDLLAAVSVASVQIEPAYYWFNSIADRGRFGDIFQRHWGLGSPDETPAAWERLSPARYSANLRIPVLMQLPEQEARLSPELHFKLIAAGLGELHVFPLAPHIKVAPRQKLAVYQRNLDWFRFWLLGEVDPDPAKVAQYARWRKLRAQRPPARSAACSQSSRSAISINRKCRKSSSTLLWER